MNTFFKRILFIALVSIGISVDALAQLEYTPTAIILTADKKSAVMMVRNNSAETRELEINAYFGTPKTDDKGNIFTEKNDASIETQYSLMPHLRVFPRKLIVGPNSEQTVKVVVTPRSALVDGAVYWARLSLKSKPVAQSAEAQSSPDSVKLAIQMVVENITGVVFINNAFNPGLDIGTVTTTSDSLFRLFVPLNAQNNIPFWGNLRISIKDQDGKEVWELSQRLAVYFSMLRRFDIEPDKLEKGKMYNVDISIDGDREEIPKRYREKIKPFQKSVMLLAQ